MTITDILSDPETTEVVPDRAYAIRRLPTRTECREMSRGLKGFVWRTGVAVTWNPCDRSVLTLVARDELESILDARARVARLIGDDPGWTYAAMARRLLRWLNIRVQPQRQAFDLLPRWHYQMCVPCRSPQATLYDLESAYWQMLLRLNTVKAQIVGDHVICQRLSRSEADRWDRLVSAVGSHKALRLAIIGLNATGWRGQGVGSMSTICYHDGEIVRPGTPLGPLQPAAMLAIRLTYEAVQVQSEAAGSIYSNVDAVVLEGDRRPEVWESVGLRYRVKATGPAEIRRIGSYKIGVVSTEFFDSPLPVAAQRRIAEQCIPLMPERVEARFFNRILGWRVDSSPRVQYNGIGRR